MAGFLDEKRKEIEGRMNELRPAVEEYRELEQALSALNGVRGGTPRKRGATRRASGSSGGGTRRRGRPRGSGTRAKEALELVRTRPGITIPELADAMGIKSNYLYRVMPTLEAEGQVVKRDGGWHPGGAPQQETAVTGL